MRRAAPPVAAEVEDRAPERPVPAEVEAAPEAAVAEQAVEELPSLPEPPAPRPAAAEAAAAMDVPPLPEPPPAEAATAQAEAEPTARAEAAVPPLPAPPIPAEPPATAEAPSAATTVRVERSQLPGGTDTAPPQATPPASPEGAAQEQELPADEIVAEAAEAAPVEAAADEPALEPADPRYRPWLRSYPPGVPDTYRYPLVPLTRLLDDAAQDFPETTAVEFGGTTLTYRQLLEKVDRFATALTGLGIGTGDRIAVALPNCPQAVIALEAAWRLGATAVLIDPAAPREQITTAMGANDVRVAVIDEQVYPVLADSRGDLRALEQIVVTSAHAWLPLLKAKVHELRARRGGGAPTEIPESSGVRRFDEVLEAAPPTATQADVDPKRDIAVILSTPEWPAGVRLTHLNLIANAFQLRLWVPDVQAGREVVLGVVPLHQAFGLTAVLGLALLSGVTIVLQDRFGGESAAKAVAGHKVTLLPCSAEMVEPLVAAAPKADLQSLRVTLVGPGELPEGAADALERAARARLRATFGIPEATALTHAAPVYGQPRPDGLGLPLPDTDCRLVDPSDPRVDVPPGAAGELLVRGPQVAAGRVGDDEGRMVDGWLRTGAVVKMDPLGHFRTAEAAGGPPAGAPVEAGTGA